MLIFLPREQRQSTIPILHFSFGFKFQRAQAILLAEQAGFPFALYDANGDQRVTTDELSIVTVLAGDNLPSPHQVDDILGAVRSLRYVNLTQTQTLMCVEVRQPLVRMHHCTLSVTKSPICWGRGICTALAGK